MCARVSVHACVRVTRWDKNPSQSSKFENIIIITIITSAKTEFNNTIISLSLSLNKKKQLIIK